MLERSLNGDSDLIARAGATYTHAVERRTAVYVLRLRYLLEERGAEPQFAEEIVTVAARREDGSLTWLDPAEATRLIEEAQPARNIDPGAREEQVRWALDLLEQSDRWYEPTVAARREALDK